MEECFGLNCSPLNSYVEILPPKVVLFGDRAIKEVRLNEVIIMGFTKKD